MAISLQELEKLIYEQQTGTKLDGKLKNADPSESISVNITLHAETWRQLLVLKTYYTLKGSRGFDIHDRDEGLQRASQLIGQTPKGGDRGA